MIEISMAVNYMCVGGKNYCPVNITTNYKLKETEVCNIECYFFFYAWFSNLHLSWSTCSRSKFVGVEGTRRNSSLGSKCWCRIDLVTACVHASSALPHLSNAPASPQESFDETLPWSMVFVTFETEHWAEACHCNDAQWESLDLLCFETEICFL